MSDLYCAECARELTLLQDDICGFCADKLQARIAELEKYRIEGVSLKTIEAVNESFRKKAAQLEAENAKLRASAVMWHKYPDEEPEPSHEYEVNIPLIVVIKTSHCWTDFAHYNLDSFRFWRHGNKEEGVTHWAYLPDAGYDTES